MELIIFDLDGTLIDSAPDLAASLNHTLERLGLPTYDEATIRRWVGNGAQMLVKRALCGCDEPRDVDERLFQKALPLFLEHYEGHLCERTALYPGVRETLAALRPKKRLAVATNKPERFVRPILEALGIDIFDMVVGGDTVGAKKPDPAMLRYITEHFGTRDALMVGDSANDILAAKAAAIPCAALANGYNQGVDLATLGPDYLLQEITELLEVTGV
jgi:phosphoglycolate phosphatase